MAFLECSRALIGLLHAENKPRGFASPSLSSPHAEGGSSMEKKPEKKVEKKPVPQKKDPKKGC